MIRIGIDLGGTGIKAGAVDEKGLILSKVSCPTKAERHYSEVIRDMADLARTAAVQASVKWEKIVSVGVGIPGIEDTRTHIVPFCTNLGWHEVPLRSTLSELLEGKPVYVANDASAAAIGERAAGAAKGVDNLVLLTLGTGVGAAVIINGELFLGAHGVATELGHVIVKFDGVTCTCGNRGCWERYSSASALIREGKELLQREPEGLVARLAEGNPDNVNAKIVIDSAKAGDPGAMQLFNDYVYAVAVGITNVINTYDPEVILLGGGVSAAGDFLLDAIRAQMPKLVFYKAMPYAKIELAKLGNDAGIIGAAMLH